MNSNTRDAIWNQAQGMKLTLDGKPARLSGRYLRFPSIVNWKDNIGCEFAWETVANVLMKGGAFKA